MWIADLVVFIIVFLPALVGFVTVKDSKEAWSEWKRKR